MNQRGLLMPAPDSTRVLQRLRALQAKEGFVSPAAVTALAAELGLPRARVEGVATFYSLLSTGPAAPYRVLFADDITDRFAGSVELARRLAARAPSATVGTTSCTGLCDQGPALLVAGRAIARLDEPRIDLVAQLIEAQRPVADWPAELFTVHDFVGHGGPLLDTRGDALAAAHALGADGMLAELQRSGLRGRGGAGFETHTKWAAARAAPGPERYVVCNADEGEPGTFKDRVLLSKRLDLVLDGLAIAALCIGAQKALIYLRGEYEFLAGPIERALAARRSSGLDLELHLGAGAYVCGEESALLESLEGKRGIPRNRPPYPATHGYLGKPTAVNNVETLACVALIALKGGAWFSSLGVPGSTGTRLHSVSGDVARPGVYELPLGASVSGLLELAGAEEVQAVQVGGPSGTLLGPHELGRALTFADVPTAGACVVFDGRRDLLEVVANSSRFFAHESCGFCTPCRVGTAQLARAVDALAAGRGTRRDVRHARQLAGLMRAASHCGLGQTAGRPFTQLDEKFRPTLERALSSLEFRPTFDLDEALAPARQLTGRDDLLAHLEEHEP
ncbi:MAG: NAD(P)H-dependent oxidoreductase subunit E [Myxococcaceae bacterium]|nr:NAD(P)H-dependent oxidoreductase subunit E [Myxococcaceae bacterium]